MKRWNRGWAYLLVVLYAIVLGAFVINAEAGTGYKAEYLKNHDGELYPQVGVKY